MNFLAIAFSGPVFWLASAVALTGILHMVVVKLDLFPAFKLPLDGGRSFRGKRIFGDNKTWRGVCFMIVGSAAVGFVQGAVGGAWAASAGLELIAYSAVGSAFRAPEGWTSFAVGYAIVNTIFGLGYALGELPNSFLKRRIDIIPGKRGAGVAGAGFFVLDQADSVIAALFLGALAFGYSWTIAVAGTLTLTVLHLVINAALRLASIRKNL